MLIFFGIICFLLSILSSWSNHLDITSSNEYWDVNTQKGIMRGQSLRLSKVKHESNHFHTCYNIKCDGKHCPTDNATSTIQVCYPAVIVTGLLKCGTSAMYDLLSRMPGAVMMHEKENCPLTRRRAHWQYFSSLPTMNSLSASSIIIDGCIDVVVNMKIRAILHNPNVVYIVMIRDYADMLWSSYNFWCKMDYDKHDCDYSKWADSRYHIRSPELFHDLLLADANGSAVVQPFHKPMHRPCVGGAGYYTDWLDTYLYANELRNHTIIVASEELESFPLAVVQRVAQRVGNSIAGMEIQNFTKVRVNSQENKGTTHSIAIEQYRPGLYNISGYRPMLPATREFINQCWREDCLKISRDTGYSYAACSNITNLKQQTVKMTEKVGLPP